MKTKSSTVIGERVTPGAKPRGEASQRNVDLRRRYLSLEARAEELDLSSPELRRLTREMDEIAEAFIISNVGLIGMFVKRYAVREDDVADMIQEGRYTIWDHFCKWDPERMSFAAFVTQGLVHDVRELQGRLQGRGSYRQILGRSKVLSCAAELPEKLGRSASDDEIAIELSMDSTRVHNLRRSDERSLSAPIGENLTLGDTIFLETSYVSQADEDAEYGIWLSALKAATEHLEILDVYLLIRRDGLDGWPAEKFSQLAAHLGIGREVLRRREARARKSIKDRGLALPERL
jgi:DNA-directed RNA polymerase sigma subunit (sigma70/sigma32)